MRGIVKTGIKLSLSEKFSRLTGRLRDPQWRRFGGTLLFGKMLGLALTFFLMLALPALIAMVPKVLASRSAYGQQAAASMAATTPDMAAATAAASSAPASASAPAPVMVTTTNMADPTINGVINPLNTVWTLVAAFLVFGMQAGFTMLEAGFCRSRETVNVLVECVFDTCLCGMLFYAWGYAFMFGAGQRLHRLARSEGLAGGAIHNWFFLQNVDRDWRLWRDRRSRARPLGVPVRLR